VVLDDCREVLVVLSPSGSFGPLGALQSPSGSFAFEHFVH
jgi:hypothetical protein